MIWLKQLFRKCALRDAAQASNLDEVKRLLADGVDKDARDEKGMTPLHYAAALGHTAIVGALLGAGADQNAKDKDSMTPLGLARESHRTPLVAAQCRDAEGTRTPQEVTNRYAAIVAMLVAAGATEITPDEYTECLRMIDPDFSPLYATHVAIDIDGTSTIPRTGTSPYQICSQIGGELIAWQMRPLWSEIYKLSLATRPWTRRDLVYVTRYNPWIDALAIRVISLCKGFGESVTEEECDSILAYSASEDFVRAEVAQKPGVYGDTESSAVETMMADSAELILFRQDFKDLKRLREKLADRSDKETSELVMRVAVGTPSVLHNLKRAHAELRRIYGLEGGGSRSGSMTFAEITEKLVKIKAEVRAAHGVAPSK